MATLSYMKIGKKEFFFEVGDEFTTNGSSFTYSPIGAENRKMCNRSVDRWHSSKSISVPKNYQEIILSDKLTNFQLVRTQKYDNFSVRTWKVTSVEKVEIKKEDLGELWYIGIGLNKMFDKDKERELFNIKIVKIKDRTPKQITLKESLNYRDMYNSEEYLNKIFMKSGPYSTDRLDSDDTFCVFVEVPSDSTAEDIEKIEAWKDQLYERMKNTLNARLKLIQDEIAKFNLMAEKIGY